MHLCIRFQKESDLTVNQLPFRTTLTSLTQLCSPTQWTSTSVWIYLTSYSPSLPPPTPHRENAQFIYLKPLTTQNTENDCHLQKQGKSGGRGSGQVCGIDPAVMLVSSSWLSWALCLLDSQPNIWWAFIPSHTHTHTHTHKTHAHMLWSSCDAGGIMLSALGAVSVKQLLCLLNNSCIYS